MFEVMRCKTCSKLRLWKQVSNDPKDVFCSRCGSGVVCGPGYYSVLDRIRLAWWCVRENWRDGAIRSPWNLLQCVRLGLTPVLPK